MNLAKKAVSVGLSAALLATLVATVAAPAALAAVSVTTPGDTTVPGNNAFIPLAANPVITLAASATNDVGAGTMIFTLASGFTFNTASAVTATVSNGTSGTLAPTTQTVTPTATSLTLTFTVASGTPTTATTITLSGIQVRAIQGDATGTVDVIAKPSSGGGTAVTNPTSFNIATLTESNGAPYALSISPSSQLTTVGVASGTYTISSTATDWVGNNVTVVAGNITSVTGTGSTTCSPSSGSLTFTCTSTVVGTKTITATSSVGGVTGSGTATISVGTGGPYGTKVPYVASSTSVPADGASTIVFTFNNVTPGANTISISTSAGSFSAASGFSFVSGFTPTYPTTTLSSITAIATGGTLTLKAPTVAGTANVTVQLVPTAGGTATYDSIQSFTFSASTLPTVSTSYSSNTTQPSSIPASPTGDTGLYIGTTVRDPNNNAISVGATVTWTLSPLGYFAGGSNTYSTTSNTAGVYNSAHIFSTGAVGATTLTTSITYLGVTYTLPNATITFVGAPAKIVLSNNAYVLAAGGLSDSNALLAVVTDAAGNAIKAGITLSVGTYTPANIFTITPGTYSSTDGAWDIAAVCPSADGTATVTVTVPSGSSTITSNAATLVCADPLSSTTQGSFTVSAKSPTVAPNSPDVITVNVKDDNGLPAVDGTSVVAVTNGVGNVVSSAGTASASTSNGTATFTYLAPSNAGSATVTVFVGNTTTGSAAVTLTIGTPAPAVSYTAASALGVTTSGPFTTATKLPAIGKYVTWQFSFGSAAAGKNVTILWEAKSASGTWPGMKAFTGRIADANGNVYFHWKFTKATWISVEAQLGTTMTPARQARWM